MQNCTKFLELYQDLAEVQKLVGTFTPGTADDLEYQNEYLYARLVRFMHDRMTFEVHSIREDGAKLPLFHSVWHYQSSTAYSVSEIKLFGPGVLSVTGCLSDEVKIEKIVNLWNRESVTLKYPLDEGEYFQRLTQIQLVPEEWIDKFMYTSQYVLESTPLYVSFHTQLHLDNPLLNETSTENVVQYVMDATKGLMKEEIERFKMQGY